MPDGGFDSLEKPTWSYSEGKSMSKVLWILGFAALVVLAQGCIVID